ncbi:uncharacterized protein LOC112683958 [Sipha flava]|uniref:Uncharacterized protein LOC112683958 n=1 Tax=Sipha flava TaxID=143950 RepID=A0A8B8FJC8_9HEMI|nr:uncharacterized protein LOC112683958 [Sipha flava]
MTRIGIVDIFWQMTGCTDDKRLLYLTYVESSITIFYFITTLSSLVFLKTDILDIQLFALLCLLIESFILLSITFRLYHQNDFREMNYHSKMLRIPEDYQSKIDALTVYHIIAPNIFVITPFLYTVMNDSVFMGDPFTFPYLDVFPIQTNNVFVYTIKYMVYAVSVYIAHLELSFINILFIYYAGIVKGKLDLIINAMKGVLADNDEKTLKKAIIQHQEFLKYFETMKNVYGKPILLTISFNAIYFGLTTSLVIQAIQGFLNPIIFSICVASSIAAIINMTIYTSYGSIMSDSHDDLLRTLFDYPLLVANKSFKRNVLIMMTRTIISLDFTIGYIFYRKFKFTCKDS